MALTEEQKKYQREWYRNKYKNNPDLRKRVNERNKERRERVRVWLEAFRRTHPCEHCGENHPATLDFHHLDPLLKDFPVSQMAKLGYSEARIQEEIAKCIVLCANCHRKLHWNERQV